MWEAIQNVLVSKNGLVIIALIAAIIWIAARLGKHGLLKIHTSHVSLGDDTRERIIIREQIDWTHTYLQGLIGKIQQVTPDLMYDGYFTKYILEVAFDEIVKWITFNHITIDEAYIKMKQDKICSLVYAQSVRPEFRTPEFQERMKRWVKEIIEHLVDIRKIYTRG